MPYADPEKNRECRRRYKAKPEARARATEIRKKRLESDPEYAERQREAVRKYRERHPDRVKARNAASYEGQYMSRRNSSLKILYGVDVAWYEQRLQEQEGRCAICGTTEPGAKKQFFCVDHCHKTGKVRQLLCTACNVGLGRFGDNLDLMKKAVAYLERHGE